MRLYCTPAGSWAGTEADAKAIAKAEGSTWERVEVPVDKPGLLAFLNEHHVGATERPVEALEPPPAPAVPSPPIKVPEAAPWPAKVARDIGVEEEIAGADFANTIRLAGHVMFRLREHVQAATNLAEEGQRYE